MKFCLRNACHLGASVDLLIEDAKIVTMTPAGHEIMPKDCPSEDAEGLLLFPSFTDAHTHLREPGFEYREDINSGLKAALHGGFAQIMCMANTAPVNDNASVTSLMLEKARQHHPDGPKLYPIAAATNNLEGTQLAPLDELKNAGCVAVSNDGKPIRSTEIMRRVLEYAADLNLTVIDHCEDPDLANGWIMHEGELSGRLGLKGQPAMGEALQIARDVMLAEYLKLPVHIAHVSSELSVDIIRFAKSRGVKITAETCPHYLLLDESAMLNYSANAKVSPPLRSLSDRDALRKAVKDGTLDILVTDHAPHASHEKDRPLVDAPCGFTGLDLAMSLSWRLVLEQVLLEADLHQLWGVRPAKIFNLPFNNFNPGDPANFFLFDPKQIWFASAENFYSKSANTPFLGQSMQGKVKHHWINGKKLF